MVGLPDKAAPVVTHLDKALAAMKEAQGYLLFLSGSLLQPAAAVCWCSLACRLTVSCVSPLFPLPLARVNFGVGS
jgi:hypothetical protein|eukprot:COSAG01_NODE_1001_length_12210_cov_60.505491_11_plen_75_part_00